MKRLVLFAFVALIAAEGSYWIARRSASCDVGDQWAWLQREFRLEPPQLARIKRLDAAYRPTCLEQCSLIMAAKAKLARLAAAGVTSGPDYVATRDSLLRVQRQCNAATMHYLRTVAAAMSPAEGRRYLAIMIPRVADPDRVTPVSFPRFRG